jgi:anaerobic magnesium-protoporphyrin IX monomethyl ester cyclase
MSDAMRPLLLLNPRITSRRGARFPLSIMTLASALRDRNRCELIDGNLEEAAVRQAVEAVRRVDFEAVGITVMGGPQLATALELTRALHAARPELPIVWGGYFPTLNPDAALSEEGVDALIRGQGEDTLREWLEARARGERDLSSIRGLSWRREGSIVHNPARAFSAKHIAPPLDYALLRDPKAYLVRTFLGKRTAAHQAALGCRFRCTFCGVAALFRGAMALPPAERLDRELAFLKHELGADSLQFYDHNFFDREEDMAPLLEVLARHQLPWWCYARADALLNLSPQGWQLVRASRLRMAYIGAETPNDQLLRAIRKGTRADQTLEVAELCRRQGVIPELSFMVAPPEDPEGETERTFEFIRRVKKVNPQAEIIVYVYTPVPEGALAPVRQVSPPLRDLAGGPVVFPTTAAQWTERRWVDYACHADAPWVSERLRRRIADFVTVLGCRFPTVTDVRSSPWSKRVLRTMAAWRYGLRRYDRPWELDLMRGIVTLHDPKTASL